MANHRSRTHGRIMHLSTQRSPRVSRTALATVSLCLFSLITPAAAAAPVATAQPLGNLELPGFSPQSLPTENAPRVKEIPGFGHVPNVNLPSLIGGKEPEYNSGKGKQLTAEQARVAAASPLNSLPLSPARASGAGTLVDSEEAQLMVDHKLWNADAHRYHYNSTDSMGNASVDSAIVVVPKTPWQGEGARPVVAIAPGTQGSDPSCDPSVSMQTGPKVRIGPLDMVAPYEAIPLVAHLKRGAAVVMIDHHRNAQGNQEYVDNISSAQSLLDATVAARQLGVADDAPVGIYGYSQGGSAAAAAAERAESYAPELDIRATSAGGPPSNLTDVLDTINGTKLTAAIALAVNSVLDKDLELKRVIEEEMSEDGRNLLDTVGQYCVVGLTLHHGLETTDQYTADKVKLATIIDRFEPIKKELERQRIGNFVPSAPVFLYSGANDDTIPIEQVRQLRDAWTNLGFTELTYLEDETPSIIKKSGANHVLGMLNNLEKATDFIWEHFPEQPSGTVPGLGD